MRNIFLRSTAVAAFFMLAGIAMAQPPHWYAHREDRYRGEQWRGFVFAEVREDLDHVQATTFNGRDEFRLVRTKQQLNELQSDFTAHRYSQAKLDQVIATLQRVVADNRMRPSERDILNDDLQRLRDYREHHEHWQH